MSMDNGWKPSEANLSGVYQLGSEYLYGLAIDYEKYVKDFGFIPIDDFIQGWTCIPPYVLETLQESDNVYDYKGQSLVVVDSAYTYDDDNNLCIEVSPEDDQSNSYILNAGELYSYNVIHKDYFYKSIKLKGEPLCPILITKTKQPQS